MRAKGIALVAVFIAVLMITPLAFNSIGNQFDAKQGVLSSGNYTENLSVYLTAGETFWKVNLVGGNINVSSVTVPASVTGYSITLTQYDTWQSDYEIFTQYGFGLLGNFEPYQAGAVLTINGSSSTDATSLANSLDQEFGLAFIQTNTSTGSYTFFSPINFVNEFNTYFYGLVPQSAGGFATMFTESQFESNDLNYFQLTYSSSTYSLTMGGLSPLLSDSFTLYGQLGLTQSSYNYSSSATSSTIDIYVLGGLIDNSSEPFTNHAASISSTIEMSKSTNSTVPDINASLDFSFPTIVAYRQITPSLTPSSGNSVTVTITVTNVSPSGGATADGVYVNDNWINSLSSSFHLTQTTTSNNETLAPGVSYSVIYAFTVNTTSGTFAVPATPVTYQYEGANNQTATGESLLNPETIVVGGSNTPELEATATIASGTIQSGQPYSVNVTIVNKGSGPAFSLSSSGLSKANLPAGSTWSYLSNQSSSSLTQTNASISYSVTWQDASGASHNTTTNTINTILGFATPGSPALTLTKSVSQPVSNVVNVTLSVLSSSTTTISNSTISDTIPTGATFVESYNTSSIQYSNGLVSANLSSIGVSVNESFIYSLNVSTSYNYVFLPASVSTSWDGQTITHYSGGFGLPLGVVATKVFTPAYGFQGSNVSISIGLMNEGNLPIYQVSLNNSYDPFLTIESSNSAYSATLNPGGHLNASLSANLTGSPGVYNSSSSAASFIFAGTDEIADSSVVQIDIFHLPEANITYSATKVEEGHDILINVTITNPSNVTITDITYSLTLPKDLTIRNGGTTSFTIASLGPNQSTSHTFTVITNQPDLYNLNTGKLTFEYQGNVLNGISGTLSLNINDDIPIRYGIPIVIGLVIVIGTLLYVRKLTTAPAVVKK